MSSKDHSRRRSRSPYRSRRYEDRRRRDSSDRRRYDDRRRHEDREDRRYEDKRHDEESNEPNINVVLRGLPDLATEEDIKNKLVKMEASIDDVSLIKDRDTGESRKFAFVRFTSVGHAIQFVEKNRSFIMSSYRVRVDYCHKSKLTDEKEEWRCSQCGFFNIISRRVCVECRQSYISSEAEKRTNALEAIEMNDGSKDISFSPSTMLLIRQLDHLSNEETVYNAVQSFQGVHRALLVRDKLTKMSCEFAFIEFTNIQYAAKALEQMKDHFNIDGKQVLVTFANPDSFIPVYGQSEYAIPSDVMDGLWAYWDKSSYVTQYSPLIEEERKRKEAELKRLKEEETKNAQLVKKSLENDLSAFYADMGDFDSTNNSDIFSVPKIK